MKYLTFFLILVVFFNFSLASLSAQVLESDYVREGAENQGEVLGIEEGLEVLNEAPSFSGSIIIDVLGVLGGLVIIALFVYIVYSKKEDS